MSCCQIFCDVDQEKRDCVRSISKKTLQGLDWFRPSQRVIAMHPVLLYYVVKGLVAPDKLWTAIYIDWKTALQIWQIFNSVTISTNMYPIRTPS
jgi:hypothetical protein